MTPFGTLSDGRPVDAITLSGHGLSVTVLTYGAIVQDVRLDGVEHSLTVGSSDVADYEGTMQYHGCIVAPVANRLSNASAIIAGQSYTFEANHNGQHTLHSGTSGAHRSVWDVDEIGDKHLILYNLMADGQGGFPANRKITAHFEILAGPTLRLTLTTTSDAPSIVNATNHSYWNLDGTGHTRGHTLQVTADHYLPTDAHSLVTGDVKSVAKTLFDFRKGADLIPDKPALDNTFCIAQGRREMTECLSLTGASGIAMTVATTEAGVHVYDGRDSNYSGVAIEAQSWPDAPNHPHFPAIDITADAPVVQVTEWRFSR